MRHPRTLVFGLDGFDFEFAERLAERGQLPWLAGQLQSGSLIRTHCPTLPGSEWVSAACGVSAAEHRYLHTSQLRLGTYEQAEIDARVVASEPFYVPLARAGVETIVVDLPVDRPRPAANLVQVIDWGTEFKLWRYSTTPRHIAAFVRRAAGRHPFTNYGTTYPDETTLLHLRQQLLAACELKSRLIQAFLSSRPTWSVTFAGFGEIHKAGHFFWCYQDPSHPDYGGEDHPLAGALTEQYRKLDAELTRICALAGDDVDVVVVTDRGMTANHRGDHLVPTLLQRWGLYPPSGRSPASDDDIEAQLARLDRPEPMLRRIKRRIPVALRPAIRRLAGFEPAWKQIKVFPVAEVGNTYLRVNVRGREPDGVVSPGRDYETLLQRLEQEFRRLINPATGQCPVADVRFPQREFAGRFSAELPDVAVIWSDHAPITALESPSIGRVEGLHWEQRSGNHTSRGAMLVAGPSFVAAASRDGDLRELAPTLLSLHGVPVPRHYECVRMPEWRRE